MAVAFMMLCWDDLDSERAYDATGSSSFYSRQLELSDNKNLSETLVASPITTCSPEAIGKLISVMSSNLEHSSLRPLSISLPKHKKATEEEMSHHFNGFDPAPLRDNRIAIVGDSTLREFSILLEWLLRPKHARVVQSMKGMTLSKANNYIERQGYGFTKHLVKKQHTVFDEENDNALLYLSAGSEWESNVRQTIIQFRPRVMLVNIGLHLFHFWNYGRDINRISNWIKYEDFLAQTVKIAEEAGAELLLLKTTNFICERKYEDSWLVGQLKYRKEDPKTLDWCFASVRKMNPDLHLVNDEDIVAYCRDASFIEHGSRKLNERLRKFVNNTSNGSGSQKVKDGTGTPHSRLKIAVFNDHDLQSCKTTTARDGRHHVRVNLARIRLLGNYINCMQDWS
eukprot:scaffold47789_cov32-Cyclotella_meneghiniana.AAC.3